MKFVVQVVKTVVAKWLAYGAQSEKPGEPVSWTKFHGGVAVASGWAA